MLQPTDNNPTETLSQLRLKICSVRLPSSCKLVDICVIMEVDNKYTYRTELIRKPTKSNTSTNSLININETLDTLVTSNSKIKLKVHAPTRLFGNNDLGKIEFDLKLIIDDYCLKNQNTSEASPSYRIQLPFQNSTPSSNFLRSNEVNNLAVGMIEVIFYGSILEQRQEQQPTEVTETSVQPVNGNTSNEPQTNETTTSEPTSPIDETRLAQLRQQVNF